MEWLFTLINKFFTIGVVLPALILLGGYLSWRLRCVQVTKLKMGFAQVFQKDKKEERAEGSMSTYQAAVTVVASGFGTGNISGMAVALALGGPGALLWMWVMTFLGSAIQFGNAILGVKYREKNKRNELVGGPMYYLKKGIGWNKMATLFAVFAILIAFTAGDFVQVNSVALPLTKIGISPWITGVAMMFVVGFAVLGGAMRIASVSSVLVPAMALFYIGGSLVALGMCHDQLLGALSLIGKSAFGFGPAIGGIAGFGVMQAALTGFNRAIFATNAGTGLPPMLQSASCSKHPVIDGVAALLGPFMVMLVCTVTFLLLMVTGAYQQPGLQSTNMVLFGFSQTLGSWGAWVVFIALFLFAYTTLITLCACLDRAVEYLFGDRWIKRFRWLYILLVPVGALLHVNLAWVLADVAMTTMLVINVLGTAMLSKEIEASHRDFFGKKLEAQAE